MRFTTIILVAAGFVGSLRLAGAEDERRLDPQHWAFRVPALPSIPRPDQRRDWPRNPIDAFVLVRLTEAKIAPSPQADRVTLIRRLSLDLIGLPPTPSEVDEFLEDRRPEAYERLVDRLLASPHYGERWGRWWLDAARYADSNGYSIDAPRSIWKYRDWVVSALNRDLPFDQFTIEQLAGDLLPGSTLDQKIATGFHRNTQINQEGGIDPEQFRVEAVIDRVNTTATVFLGLTLGCAQCHDHKFDPFSQRDYYRLFAFFNNQAPDGHGKGTPGGQLEIPGEFEALQDREKEIEDLEADLDRYLATQGDSQRTWEQNLSAEQNTQLPLETREAIRVPFSERSPQQRRIAYQAFRGDDPEFKQRNARLLKLIRREPKPVTTLVMEELQEQRETRVLIKGDFTRPGEVVRPDVPSVLPRLPRSPRRGAALANIPNLSTDVPTRPPNRLDLAHWIVNTNNPLTARVIVNRVWQQYFGKGIVETENDFGTQGSPPSHPELLDWLAWAFMAPGQGNEESRAPSSELRAPNSELRTPTPWSLKRLHRLIVTSATYRQSSRERDDLRRIDPGNRLLARQNRVRLDAEVLRDVVLAASGLLSAKIGGPPVFPPQPEGVMTLGQVQRTWKASTGEDRYRRGLYTHLWRATPYPALAVFDAPDGFSACTRRLRSNTPLQALTLLNDEAFYESAIALADRVLREGGNTDRRRLNYAFRLCLSRKPSRMERNRIRQLLNEERKGSEEAAAWTAVSRVLLNLDETITRE